MESLELSQEGEEQEKSAREGGEWVGRKMKL